MKKYLTQSGFTLIEIMIVLAIISILVVLIVPNASDIIDSANTTGCTAITRSKEASDFTNSIMDIEGSISQEDIDKVCNSN